VPGRAESLPLGGAGAAGLRAGGVDSLGPATFGRAAELGEVRQSWGWTLIQAVTEVRGWLATLGRLILWGFQTLCPLSIPKLAQEAILTP